MANGLTMRTYDEFVNGIALYPVRLDPSGLGIVYCGLGVSGEGGEVGDKIKKIWRDKDLSALEDADREHILAEAGDVLWYLAALAGELHSSLEEIAVINIEKLKARRAKNTLQGEGDDR